MQSFKLYTIPIDGGTVQIKVDGSKDIDAIVNKIVALFDEQKPKKDFLSPQAKKACRMMLAHISSDDLAALQSIGSFEDDIVLSNQKINEKDYKYSLHIKNKELCEIKPVNTEIGDICFELSALKD